jgi:hypothetical protein
MGLQNAFYYQWDYGIRIFPNSPPVPQERCSTPSQVGIGLFGKERDVFE